MVPVSTALVSFSGLLATVSLLNGNCSSLLGLNSIRSEFGPEFFKFSVVALKVEWVIDDQQVFLIALSSLEGPVEGAGHNEDVVDDHELVVHVVLGGTVSAYGDSSISQGLAVVTLVCHALVISDDTYRDALLMNVLHSSGKNIVSEVEDTDMKSLLSHLDVSLELVHVAEIGEEEGVKVAGLWSHQILLNLANVLAQVCENFLVSIA